MAGVHKTIVLEKGKNLLRFSNTSSEPELNLAVITPHDEVFDGFELFVILEIPTQDNVVSYMSGFSSHKTLEYNNIKISRGLIGFEYIYPSTKKNAPWSPASQKFEQLCRLIWDAKNNCWIIVSVTAINPLS